MNIALINKETSICENIAVFEDMQTAMNMFSGQYVLAEPQDGYWIDDIYKDGVWSKVETEPVQLEPTIEEYLLDLDYRLSLQELGGTE